MRARQHLSTIIMVLGLFTLLFAVTLASGLMALASLAVLTNLLSVTTLAQGLAEMADRSALGNAAHMAGAWKQAAPFIIVMLMVAGALSVLAVVGYKASAQRIHRDVEHNALKRADALAEQAAALTYHLELARTYLGMANAKWESALCTGARVWEPLCTAAYQVAEAARREIQTAHEKHQCGVEGLDDMADWASSLRATHREAQSQIARCLARLYRAGSLSDARPAVQEGKLPDQSTGLQTAIALAQEVDEAAHGENGHATTDRLRWREARCAVEHWTAQGASAEERSERMQTLAEAIDAAYARGEHADPNWSERVRQRDRDGVSGGGESTLSAT